MGKLRISKTDTRDTLLELEEINEKNSTLKEKINKLEQSIEQLERKHGKYQEELAQLKEKNSTLEKEKQSVFEQNKNLNLQLEELEVQLSKTQKAVQKKEKEKEIKHAPSKIKKTEKAKPALTEDEATRDKWLSMEIDLLEKELHNTNMNEIRSVVKPWKVKPKGRKKVDLIAAVLDHVKTVVGRDIPIARISAIPAFLIG